ncbi:MAG: dolichyl-phosphate beta-glucosyltransferase [Methanoregula sp.]|jgi:glycosyltransferase involved in cell wall biosynthesis|uniref:dolichyl-phosphate beta-glucosyltransferase n=1 Tax=Methanoregula sp. TaxID=2052170 RepID=UPI003C1A964C
MTKPEVSAIIPVYNDRFSLETALPVSVETLSRITPAFEILIAEDGSNDGSAEFVKEYRKSDPRIRLLHSDARQGRGRALNRAIRDAQGSIVCYFDVDLATDMQHLPELIGAIREGYDISTGSRLLPDSNIVRTGGREIASRSYNFLVRLFLSSRVYDHQCGFKAFNRERILPILSSIRDNHWFWDTEILVRAQRNRYRVREFAVRWRTGKGTTVKVKDVFTMGEAILRLWWQIHVSKN